MRTISTIILLLCLLQVKGQVKSDLDFARSTQQLRTTERYTFDYDFQNELVALTSFLFVSYKYLISSQDLNACVFHPSCSVYAMQAVKSNGFFMGSLGAFDRLQRCHGLALDQYPRDARTGLAQDPL
jgi:uncharacterized protein